MSNRDRLPWSGGNGASRRALLAGTGAVTAAVVAGCASSSTSTSTAPPPRLSVDEHVDIRDYGAMPNGPDCTAAINQALTAVSQGRARYGKVRVPKGLWRVSGPLNFGLGPGGARLSFTLEGGGYSFIGGSVGGCGSNAANSYDNVHVAAQVGPAWSPSRACTSTPTRGWGSPRRLPVRR